MTRRSGFTLIELLVGLAILALLTGMISGIYSSSARFREASEERISRVHGASVMLTRLADELVIVAPEGEDAEARVLASETGARWTSFSGPSDVAAALARVLDG